MFVSHQLTGPRIVYANRRSAVRVSADDLRWLRGARLSHGPSLALIDLSLRGARFEIPQRLQPGEHAELELITDDDRTRSLVQIVRSEIAEVRPDVVRYRNACVFASPLPWTTRLPVKSNADAAIRWQVPYDPWHGWSEVVVVFRHAGPQLSGYVHNFEPSRAVIEVRPSRTLSATDTQTVPLALVRAVHVVRDFDEGVLDSAPDESRHGTVVELLFRNNQLLRGTLPSFDRDAIGFWLLAPPQARWRRVFAVSAAVAEIRLLFAD